MLAIRVSKFSEKEWLVLRINKYDKGFYKYNIEIIDVFKTQKKALKKKALLEFILKVGDMELKKLVRETLTEEKKV